MARFARIAGDQVAELIDLPDDVAPADAFHADIVADLVAAPDGVAAGWRLAPEGFLPPPAPAPDLQAYAAHRRFVVETGGIDVAGHRIATDRESQALIMGARLFVQATPSATIQFKAGAGFATLDAAAIETIALAVAAHVQAAFAVEAVVLAEIEAGTITTIEQVDHAAWPGLVEED